ncbi:MAG: tetratricopeptide repeat protein [Betaproteobacteria bacterium]
MQDPPILTTFLFTDIEGSTRLWELEPERMREALAVHDSLGRTTVAAHRGIFVKSTGDGLHAAFADPLDALVAAMALQLQLQDPHVTAGVPLRIRCGLHVGAIERRENDYFGSTVNRAARIMAIAHGGQTLVSRAMAEIVGDRLPVELTLRDLGTVRLRDLSGPEQIFQAVHPALRNEFPALRSLESTPNNLPQQLTTFVGRENEVIEVRELLRAHRLLTLCGTGGLGKTRLSLQVAGDALSDYPDGVWLVELASITDPRLVAQSVAAALGVKEEAGRPESEALLRFVRDRNLLIILDNCEHLLEACAQITMQLLHAGPKIRMLATSRESLRVRGETTYPMLPLRVPDARGSVDLPALTQNEAVRLFIDRANAVQPSFRLTARNAGPVVDICRRLDGIPLAIELAAARLRGLSIDAMASRLGDLFRLLAGGDRTALPRQQTLRALIDWSHDLLTDQEQAMLRRLAAFAGGWTIDAAEFVCAAGTIAHADVFDLLPGLIDKSLASFDSETGRYRLLETVRQYADEKLEQSGELPDTRRRHLAHFADLAEQARPELLGPQQVKWLLRLDVERENLLAAHAWSSDDELGGPAGLQLAVAMKNYFLRRGLVWLGQQVIDAALAHPGTRVRDAARSRGLFSSGQLTYVAGQFDEARRRLEESLAIAQEIGDEQRAAAVLQPLGMVLSAMGDLAGSRTCYDTAILLTQQMGNKREIATALNNRAQLHQLEHEWDAALPLLDRVLALMRELEDHENVALALLNLAMVEVGLHHRDRALHFLGDALSMAEQIGSQPVGQSVVEVCAGFAADSGRPEDAARFFGAAQGQITRTGLQRSAGDDAFLVPLMEGARAQLSPGTFDTIAQSRQSMGLAEALAEVRAWLAVSGPEP